MGDLIILSDRRAARGNAAREVLIRPEPAEPFDPLDPDPWVIDFWTGIATAITLFVACINANPTKGDQ